MMENNTDQGLQQLSNQLTCVKTLGVWWHSAKDRLGFQVHRGKQQNKGSKRLILSTIAGIFDPLGLIGPVTVVAKMIIQELWQLQLDWDATIPFYLFTKWQTFQQEIQHLNTLSIPRRVIGISPSKEIQIHGFCDASQVAYGACLYVRAGSGADYSSNLLCAKSRVAPLKTVSIPRLELCGAVLLARLTTKAVKALRIGSPSIAFWSDSTVALAWIRSSPHRWKTFVANRVTEIQEHSSPDQWLHIRTQENPANLLSRGIAPSQLFDNSLWWHGPPWLIQEQDTWPKQPKTSVEVHELPEIRSFHITKGPERSNEFFEKFSTFSKMVNVAAHCLRFKSNCQHPETRLSGPILPQERQEVINKLVRVAQEQEFGKEIHYLKNGQQVHNKSHLRSLNPFLDEDQLLKVGGRLQNSSFYQVPKHPILLPRQHPLTHLLVVEVHLKHLHAGAQSTLAAVRRKYWIVSGNQFVRGVIHRCIRCFRAKPKTENPKMGQMPASRVTPSRPFSICGVDFCGPFHLREGGVRSKRRVKAFGAVFVCFATRAVHLELVGNLSTEAFLATLRRFIGRRGNPQEIHSDNATNFTGTNQELKALARQYATQQHQDQVTRVLSEEGIHWKFIPANSPHFGGLWEAAVKAVKHHLRRVVGDAALTFEELHTVLVQVEACLNSRPISALSSDPNDLEVLTPGHFLMGSAPTSFEEPDLRSLKLNRLSRWQRVTQIMQHFWIRWYKEYLVQLQPQRKWNRSSKPLNLGDLVILREDRSPPLSWPLGRVVELHPGKDGVVRVVTLKTGSGLRKRATGRVCVLPIELST